MPIEPITYQEVINKVQDVILNNCANTTEAKYNNINTSLKSGWQTKVKTAGGHNKRTYYAQINIQKAIPLASVDDIKDDMNKFLEKAEIGLSSTEKKTNIPADEFYDFIRNMISFVCTHCCMANGQFTNEEWLVYIPNLTSYDVAEEISSTEINKLICSNDILDLIQTTMVNNVHRLARAYTCEYKWTLIEEVQS